MSALRTYVVATNNSDWRLSDGDERDISSLADSLMEAVPATIDPSLPIDSSQLPRLASLLRLDASPVSRRTLAFILVATGKRGELTLS